MDKEMFLYYKNALQGTLNEPLCKEYKDEWRACGESKEKLIKLALQQQSLPHLISYASNGVGLSKDYLKTEFKNYINGRYTVHDADEVKGYTYSLNVDLCGDFHVTTDVTAFLFCNDIVTTVAATKCPIIYVGCGSKVSLDLDGYNSVRVYLFDNSKVIVNDTDNESSVIVYKYSKDAVVESGKFCLGEVKVFEKELRL